MRRLLCLASLLLGVVFCGLLCSCDAVTRHEVLTTIFDGVPSLPPPEELCVDYVEEQRLLALSGADAADAQGGGAKQTSSHQPYKEKRCGDCHDKRTNSGLVRPPEKLCLGCHQGFIQGAFVHGPVAVSDCLACHDPHSSKNSSLLKIAKTQICGSCHQEQRVAKGMHDRLAERQMTCVDCHDPHFGKVPYFLK